MWENTHEVQFEYFVVDNASRPDGTLERVRRDFPRVRVLENDTNLGFAAGCNVAIAHATGRYILLLNPDTEVQSGAIKTLLDVMHSRSDTAVVTSRLSYGSGAFQHSAFHFPGVGQLYLDLFPVPGRFYETRLNGRYPRKSYEAGRPIEIDTPLGAVMLLRREAIEHVGLFDEEFACTVKRLTGRRAARVHAEARVA